MTNRGFTLTELLIAMGVGVFLISVSVTLHVVNLNQFRSTELRSYMAQDSLLLSDFFRTKIMAVGGGPIRGWMGLWPENNCNARLFMPNCLGSDRLSMSTLRFPIQSCAVTGQPLPNRIQAAFVAPGVCCLSAANPGEVDFDNRHAMLVLGDFYRQVYLTNLNAGTCQADMSAGQAAGGDSFGGLPNWTGGTVSLVDVETYFVDPTTHQLNQFIDANNNNVADTNEVAAIVDGVFDLQVALGYDFAISDGNIAEAADGSNDEWLFNNPTTAEIFGIGYFAPPLNRNQLLMVAVGTILGTQDKNTPVGLLETSLLDGPLRKEDGWVLQGQVAQAAPRNSYVFQ
ncbi:MAG: PilW family protein [Bdellovibrionales bacterium]